MQGVIIQKTPVNSDFEDRHNIVFECLTISRTTCACKMSSISSWMIRVFHWIYFYTYLITELSEICKIIPTNLILTASDLCRRTMFIPVPECGIGHGESIQLENAVTWSKYNLNGMNIYEEKYIKFLDMLTNFIHLALIEIRAHNTWTCTRTKKPNTLKNYQINKMLTKLKPRIMSV